MVRIFAAVALLAVPALGWSIPMPHSPRIRSTHAAAIDIRNLAALEVRGGDDAPRPGPAGAFDKAVKLGAAKAALPWTKILPLAFAWKRKATRGRVSCCRRRCTRRRTARELRASSPQ